MLESLRLTGFGVVEEATLELGPGLTALTGETGAGKTMIVAGLGQLLGARGDAGVVRHGQPKAVVEGRWLVLEGELLCTRSEGEVAIPYRFLVERTGGSSFRQRPYTAESLHATGNWNVDTQLQYGAFRSRSHLGIAAPQDVKRP